MINFSLRVAKDYGCAYVGGDLRYHTADDVRYNPHHVRVRYTITLVADRLADGDRGEELADGGYRIGYRLIEGKLGDPAGPSASDIEAALTYLRAARDEYLADWAARAALAAGMLAHDLQVSL